MIKGILKSPNLNNIFSLPYLTIIETHITEPMASPINAKAFEIEPNKEKPAYAKRLT